jgi:multicomponent Na+:H+ antiporter subunit F
MDLVSHIIAEVAVGLIGLSVVLTLFSLLYFRPLIIKLICLEVLANILITAMSLWSLLLAQPLIIDISLAIALIMFVSTLAYCRFITSRE